MIFKTAALLLASASILVEGSVIPRETDYLNEGVLLARCKTYAQFPGNSGEKPLSVQSVAYYNQLVDAPNSLFLPGTATDGAGKVYDSEEIDWTTGKTDKPITASIQNTGPFKVWDLTNKGDPKTGATGSATLNGKDMRCYVADKDIAAIWRNTMDKARVGKPRFTDCAADYVCTRSSRKVRRTNFEFSEDTLDVLISVTESPMEPQVELIRGYLSDALGNLTSVYKPDIVKSTGELKIVSADAKLAVEFKMQDIKGDANFDSERMKNIQNQLVQKLVNKLFSDKGKPDCKMGFGAQYATCAYPFKFPKQIYIASQVAEQQEMDWQPKDEITIVAISQAKNAKCEQNKAFADAMSVIFGLATAPVGAWGGAVAGAVVGDLGMVFGKVGGAAC
ncbi:hypothetical protein DM02DRAFT_671468 [Periconia macrospinosa]|uniref:Uncharacterized protein n=1 Tax=Periconia macrospinosa TaxID=97972 RepID=A0A2V1DSV7_9PLEO|nr:hypothetical protein DM02DRAFT_671468 [Periconia macrospinosa]